LRVAVVNQFSSAGGGARFVRALVTALARTCPDLEITLFADWTAVERDGLDTLFADAPNVAVHAMRNGLGAKTAGARPRLWRLRQVAKRLEPLARAYYAWQTRAPHDGPAWFDFGMDEQTLTALGSHDVVHLAWPYFVEPADIVAPVVMTMHDFNYKYPFGNFSDRMLALVEEQTPRWLAMASRVVVSADFMRDELARFYPDVRTPVDVIRLTHFSITEPTEAEVRSTLSKFGLTAPFVICASNTSRHKNLEVVLRAAGQLKRRGISMRLVLAGYNTDHLGKYAGAHFPPNHPLFEYQRLTGIMDSLGLVVGVDLYPLGYVSDMEIDALIRSASLVIAPSLYEAGSGPAVDAWSVGTSVAFSDIAPFREHLRFLGTEAYLFDPHDPDDVAKVLAVALRDPDGTKAMGERSQKAIARYTWEDVARSYRESYLAATGSRAGSV
jgi:glycosyltransferase involved in cell wall biosynthesis